MRKPSLGEQELELLRYVAEHLPVTVGSATEQYGEPRGLTRSTVKTMLERLHRKGHLTRDQRGGVFHYTSALPKADLLQGLVRQFVERTLAGSLSPFVHYLANGKDLSDEEFSELEQLVAQLDARRKVKEA